jgi:spore coat polysaccharide biosynthesis protein SpsF
MRKVIILQARLASSRLPKKVLADLSGKPVIAHIVDRLKASRLADEVCVAIPSDAEEDPLAEALTTLPVSIVRGSAHDVLGRYIQAAYQTQADVIVRATGDNPLVCPHNLDLQLKELTDNPELDYVITEGYPSGITTEAFTLKTLEKLDYLARGTNMREHVTLQLRKHPGPFELRKLQAPPELCDPTLKLSIDTAQDYQLLSNIYKQLYRPGEIVDLDEVMRLFKKEPQLAELARIPITMPVSA